jgi:hypothetical protein
LAGAGNGDTAVEDTLPTLSASGQRFSSVQQGSLYACALDATGAAYCWGSVNQVGRQGNGTVLANLTPTPVVGGHLFTDLDANDNNTSNGLTCGVTAVGDAYCWGRNEGDAFGDGFADTCRVGATADVSCALAPVRIDSPVEFASVSVGLNHVCGLARDQRVYCWGVGDGGQLGDGGFTNSARPIPIRNP